MADWKVAFKTVVEKSIEEQRDLFLNRFTLQVSKQGKDAKEFVKVCMAIAKMFLEKAASGGKSLKYGGVEFGDIYNEFVGENLTFIERKKTFAPFDLDNNGVIDLVEFLLYFHREQIIVGYKERNDVQSVDNEAEALMEELVSDCLFADPKMDAAVLGLKKLKAAHEAALEKTKKDAQEGGKVKQIQLPENLKKLEKKYEEDQKGFLRDDAIAQKLEKVEKAQAAIVKEMKAILEKEDEEARGPSKK